MSYSAESTHGVSSNTTLRIVVDDTGALVGKVDLSLAHPPHEGLDVLGDGLAGTPLAAASALVWDEVVERLVEEHVDVVFLLLSLRWRESWGDRRPAVVRLVGEAAVDVHGG